MCGNEYSTLMEKLLNKLSRIKIAKLISFLTENEDLIKQQPDAISSSDSDSPSPRPQTDGPRPSRGSISRTRFPSGLWKALHPLG
ncbi:hypothetical protein AVEN_177566-1 [Araneus ventricosus]|uniref:Uncharacterized protein n=1 Tax=Araneus ventricosus TaxID=182803 RepID=A0A4Y2LJY4_ARAVE|nr:hypothetical protein AVEN_177566-1 [Araneus ventricosus]